jgi:DNA-directed RNA polymerase subunit alpha
MFSIGPLDRGFGTTFGNTLRRVLLSSLAGVAVSSVKIKNILHEFTYIPDVKEDVIEIILNIKKLAIKNLTERRDNHTGFLNVSGQCEVFAGDIMLDSDLEISNKDLHIATLSSKEANLNMELYITNGYGYVSSEKNKNLNSELGVIAVDSIYTPIERVNFSVEDMRIGNITNFDKLILEIWTNKTIMANDALEKSAKIIQDYASIFTNVPEEIVVQEKLEVVSQEEMDREKILKQPIEELELSVRSYNCLKRSGVNTIADLIDRTLEDMQKVRNLGRKSYEEVLNKIAAYGLSLKSEIS